MSDGSFRSSLTRRAAGILAGVALAALGLGACSHQPPAPQPPDMAQVDRWVIREYLSGTRSPVVESRDTLGTQDIPVDWTLPAQGTALPLVVYLPGLGESSAAGDSWRHAWAASGYAVLTIENADNDLPPPPPPPRVRPDDSSADAERAQVAEQRDALHDWAISRFTPEAATERLARLDNALTGLLARTPGSDTPSDRIDRTRAALAGFDAGAYTAMLAVGEVPRPGWALRPLPLAVQAVIALSPHADFSGTGFQQRYREIHVPVLSVSSTADQDEAGLVTSSFVRRAPFDNLPGQAALLWLRDSSHHVISGSTQAGIVAAKSRSEVITRQAGGNTPGSGRQGRGNRNPGQNQGQQQALIPISPAAANGGPRPRSSTEDAIDQAIIAGTTTAFLDAVLKGDPSARQWLAGDARGWLGQRGEWRVHAAK
jgi:dienelactone hydrolase